MQLESTHSTVSSLKASSASTIQHVRSSLDNTERLLKTLFRQLKHRHIEREF